jgi:VCBS repeat-containing protein
MFLLLMMFACDSDTVKTEQEAATTTGDQVTESVEITVETPDVETKTVTATTPGVDEKPVVTETVAPLNDQESESEE